MRRLLLILVLAVTILGSGGAGDGQSRELRIGLPRLPVVLDPATAQDASDRFLYPQIFETLVRFRDGGTDVEPGLATSWQVSRDGLTWSFRLRPNVRFHDGTLLTADHVVLALQRQMAREHPLHPNPPALWPVALGGLPGLVRAVGRTDAATVRIELAQPFAPLLAVLAHPALAIVLPTSDVVAGATRPFLGTGPFRLAGEGSGVLTLEAHPAYWGGAPRLGQVTLREITDEAVALGDFLGGRLDVLFPSRPPAEAPSGSVPARLVSAPTGSLRALSLNVKREPLKRKKVRQALALALDPALVGPALGPSEEFARAFLPAGFWGAVAGSFYSALNLSRARALLAEERLGEGAPLTLIAERAPGGPDLAPVAEALRIAWAAAGIQLRVQIESPEIFRAALRAGEYEVALTEMKVPVLDPHFLFAPLVTQNGSHDPRVADLVLRAGQVSFRPERLRLYQRLQALLAEELLWLPLSHQLQWVLVRPEVRDFRLRPSGTAPLHAVGVQP